MVCCECPMKSFANFSEDIEDRRLALKQKQADQLASFKEKGAGVQQAAGDRLAATKEKQDAAAERATAARDAIKQKRQEAEARRKEIEAKKKEREDISKEIAASREEHQQDRVDQKKKNDQKRMGKARAEREE